MDFGFPAAVLTSLVAIDSFIYSIGVVADSVPPYSTGNIFVKCDLAGNIINTKTLHSNERTIETWKNTFQQLSDGNFVASGNSSISDGTKSIFEIKYNLEGDTIGFNEYFHPWLPEYPLLHNKDFYYFNHSFYFTALARVNFNPNDVDYYVLKVDSSGILQWDYFFGTNRWDVPESMIINQSNGNILVGGIKTNQNFTNSDYQFQTYIISLDSLGNLQWTYLSPIEEGLRDGANDMILLEDGSLIVASGIGYEQERPSVNVVWFEKSVFKLNANLDVEWEKEFKGSHISGLTNTNSLIDISDGSGFLVTGISNRPNPTVEVWGSYGWLTKMSYDGDSLWTREYAYLSNNKFTHTFFDLKETPDGGFILCGESRDREAGAVIPQQAWLLKLDNHGCLVPGCHLIDDIQETASASYELKLFPNPTADFLNIFMRHHRGNRVFNFRIRDATGRIMLDFEQTMQEETLMIDLAGYPNGIYFLEISQNGRILGSEKFVVQG